MKKAKTFELSDPTPTLGFLTPSVVLTIISPREAG